MDFSLYLFLARVFCSSSEIKKRNKNFVAVEREKRIFVCAKISPLSVSACSSPQFNLPLSIFSLRSLKKQYHWKMLQNTLVLELWKVVFGVSTHFPPASLPWLQQERGHWARPSGAARGGPPVVPSCRQTHLDTCSPP